MNPKSTGRTTTTEQDLESARRVLRIESEGLAALADTLGEPLIKALDILEAVSGRVIVSGMGKSGHVGRKIAATLASTGTPSFFIHPAEASHGDLGMLTPHDAVIALSNSGETAELTDLVNFTRRFAIPLIGITGKADSALGSAADATLLLPKAPEACPMGLAPTTSTTLMLGLGDALAVALLERKGFSASDFHTLHPGGQLGRRLLKVSDIMHVGDEVPLVSAETRMSEAILTITAKSFGCAGVTDNGGRLIGIVTDGDLRRHMQQDFVNLSAGEIMTIRARSIKPQLLAAEALRIMNNAAITSLFVVEEEDRPIGILHIHDCLRAGVA
jgi:arabinose-5-phosphate isomerase